MKKKQWVIRAGYALLMSSLAACVQTSTTNSNNSAGSATSTASSTASPASGNGSVDASAMITAHNEWRSKVGVSGLQWSDKLASVAQKWADHITSTSCSLGHSGNEYGENIYWAGSVMHSDGKNELSKKTPKDAVDSWGEEAQWYDYTDNSCHKECGHYTQVVWKDTKEVGCAMAVCGDNSQIWVCNYFPAGNMNGKKPY